MEINEAPLLHGRKVFGLQLLVTTSSENHKKSSVKYALHFLLTYQRPNHISKHVK